MTKTRLVMALFAAAVLAAAPAAAAEARLMLEKSPTTGNELHGTVEWSPSKDTEGHTTLSATASVPDGKLAANLVLAPNEDATLPTSHLFQLVFVVGEGFPGGNVAQLIGILSADDPAKQGTAIAGASAKIVDNQFLFAPATAEAAAKHLSDGKFMNIAVVYASGQRAILSLGLDDAARQALAAMQL